MAFSKAPLLAKLGIIIIPPALRSSELISCEKRINPLIALDVGLILNNRTVTKKMVTGTSSDST